MICKNCNSEIPNDSEYCSFCGNVTESVISSNNASGLKKGYTYLELKQWNDAEQFFRAAIINGENTAEAYIGKMLARYKTDSIESLAASGKKFSSDDDFKLAIKYADSEYAKKLMQYDAECSKRAKNKTLAFSIFVSAVSICVVIAILLVTVIIPKAKYKDALNNATDLLEAKKYEAAYAIFEEIGNTKLIKESKYNRALELYNNGDYANSYFLFLESRGYSDANEKLNDISSKLNRQIISASDYHTVALKTDGTVIAAGNLDSRKCKLSKWKDVVSVDTGEHFTVGLKTDGTVVSACDKGYEEGCDVAGWENIVAISSAGDITAGLKADGTVLVSSDGSERVLKVLHWKEIVAISVGGSSYGYNDGMVVGLKKDGTVVTTGNIPEISEWKDIVKIFAGRNCLIGLKNDGAVIAALDKDAYDRTKEDVKKYILNNLSSLNSKNLSTISIDEQHVVGLKSDGTLIAIGCDAEEYGIYEWKDLIAVSTVHYWDGVANLRKDLTEIYDFRAVAVKTDGTVIATEETNGKGENNVWGWTNIGFYKY